MSRNPLVARTIRYHRGFTWRQVGISASFMFVIGLLLIVVGARIETFFGWAMTLTLATFLGLTIFTGFSAARTTEATIRGGFYDMVLMDLTNREILLGHMLISFYRLRIWYTLGIAGIVTQIFGASLWMSLDQNIGTQIGCNFFATQCTSPVVFSTSITFLTMNGLMVSLGFVGMIMLAAAFGVSFSLRWGNHRGVLIGSVLFSALIWFGFAWLIARSLDLVVQYGEQTSVAFVVGLIAIYSLLYLMTFRLVDRLFNTLRNYVTYFFITLIIVANTTTTTAFIGLFVFFLISFFVVVINHDYERQNDPDQQFYNYFHHIQDIVIIGLSIAWVLYIALQGGIYTQALIAELSLATVILLPFILGLGLMLVGEHWTEKPIMEGYTSDYGNADSPY